MSINYPLKLINNNIDHRWKVIDQSGFCFGDGETPAEAIESASVFNDDLEFKAWLRGLL